MVIPVDTGGGFLGGQSLVRIAKDATGEVTERELLPVAFVPMVSQHFLTFHIPNFAFAFHKWRFL